MSKKVIKWCKKDGTVLEYFITNAVDNENQFIGSWQPGRDRGVLKHSNCRSDLEHYNKTSSVYKLEFCSPEETLKVLLLYD